MCTRVCSGYVHAFMQCICSGYARALYSPTCTCITFFSFSSPFLRSPCRFPILLVAFDVKFAFYFLQPCGTSGGKHFFFFFVRIIALQFHHAIVYLSMPTIWYLFFNFKPISLNKTETRLLILCVFNGEEKMGGCKQINGLVIFIQRLHTGCS